MPIAEEKQEGMVGFRRVRDKMGPVAEVETERLSISEFNTRCRFADEGQVLRLMASMEENGFIPRCAVWVNAVTEDGTHEGKVLQYRLVAGRHRHEAARRTGMEKIPCQLFYNLEPE
ncbi:MAG: ParB N-terminal domain-containing protein [Armatimonadetes bacterium]|nr:ParB N-terminal domain-containing protein [Armatimonadota bacterium]